MINRFWALVFVASGAPAVRAAVQARTSVQRDVEGYAIASCLARQTEPVLKDQGNAWMDIIIQRSRGDVEHFRAVAEAVVAQVAKDPMPMTRQESDPMHAKAVPVLLCSEIVDETPVRSAIDIAIKKLAPAYRRTRQ